MPELPEVEYQVVVSRKKGALEASLVPLVFRDGKYKILVSFMLNVEATPKPFKARLAPGAETATDRYAANSVLASGR